MAGPEDSRKEACFVGHLRHSVARPSRRGDRPRPLEETAHPRPYPRRLDRRDHPHRGPRPAVLLPDDGRRPEGRLGQGKRRDHRLQPPRRGLAGPHPRIRRLPGVHRLGREYEAPPVQEGRLSHDVPPRDRHLHRMLLEHPRQRLPDEAHLRPPADLEGAPGLFPPHHQHQFRRHRHRQQLGRLLHEPVGDPVRRVPDETPRGRPPLQLLLPRQSGPRRRGHGHRVDDRPDAGGRDEPPPPGPATAGTAGRGRNRVWAGGGRGSSRTRFT